jgi:hypothetical protein
MEPEKGRTQFWHGDQRSTWNQERRVGRWTRSMGAIPRVLGRLNSGAMTVHPRMASSLGVTERKGEAEPKSVGCP